MEKKFFFEIFEEPSLRHAKNIVYFAPSNVAVLTKSLLQLVWNEILDRLNVRLSVYSAKSITR